MSSAVGRAVPPKLLVDLANPVVRGVLGSRLHALMDRSLIVLHVTGRRTGRHLDVPVGFVALDDRLVVVTRHAWRVNLRGGADIDMTRRGERVPVHAELVEDAADVAAVFATVIERFGWRAARRLGITVRVGRAPTTAELEAAARERDLALVVLTGRAPA